MTPEKITQVVRTYMLFFVDSKIEPKRNRDATEKADVLSHAHWMCEQIISLLAEGRLEKANRWLGFVQAVMWLTKTFSIHQMRFHNAPPGADLATDRE